MDTPKIVITPEDLATWDLADNPGQAKTHPIHLRWRLASVLLILCPPILVLVSFISLLATRKAAPPVRRTCVIHWCCLLLFGLVVWAVVIFFFGSRVFDGRLATVTCGRSLSVKAIPHIPVDTMLNGRDIAQQFTPLVVAVIDPYLPQVSPEVDIGLLAYGAGVIALADIDGFLVLTSRHVIEEMSYRPGVGQEVGLLLQDHQQALATVVGIHNQLDLALLWVGRDDNEETYVQPLRSFDSIDVGEQVFAIGHPQGLAFSISAGLVSQKRNGDLVQISAPVSPGNSGGPIYDTYGKLIGVVQSVFDKSKDPNAENLNFAVRADDLFVVSAWTLADEGRLAISEINDLGPGTTDSRPVEEEQRENELHD